MWCIRALLLGCLVLPLWVSHCSPRRNVDRPSNGFSRHKRAYFFGAAMIKLASFVEEGNVVYCGSVFFPVTVVGSVGFGIFVSTTQFRLLLRSIALEVSLFGA